VLICRNVPGNIFTVDGHAPHFPSATDHFPDVQTNVVPPKCRSTLRRLVPAASALPLVLSRVHWVRPELVAEVKYLTWTDDNLLQQVVSEGLRAARSERRSDRVVQRCRNEEAEVVARLQV
jgi:ATP-dependent DNA ligase